ncbi:MAG: OmpH family outer membrane protein, partial [Pyrinomonadaceae bacterium]
KIAVIYSGAFQDAKEGISRFSATVTKLNAEFQPLQNELNQTAQRLNALQEEIKKMQGGATPATPQQIQAKINQFDEQKKAYERKGEDARLNYQKRRGELLMPLQEDVGKALDAFGKANGITLIIDGTQVPLVYAADTIDITKAFIADYNRRNPATAAVTPR